jgi:hypothetical protein
MVLADPYLDSETIALTLQTLITFHHRNAIAQPAAPYLASTTPYLSCYRDNSLPTNGTIGRIAAPGNVTYFNCRAVITNAIQNSYLRD